MNKNILIIEDDEVLGKILVDSLSKEGFLVTHSLDASQGLLNVRRLSPVVILLDLMLPAGNGVELLRTLKLSTQTQSFPVIVMTSYDDPEVQAEMETIGAHGFFRKPFEVEELLVKIKEITNG